MPYEYRAGSKAGLITGFLLFVAGLFFRWEIVTSTLNLWFFVSLLSGWVSGVFTAAIFKEAYRKIPGDTKIRKGIFVGFLLGIIGFVELQYSGSFKAAIVFFLLPVILGTLIGMMWKPKEIKKTEERRDIPNRREEMKKTKASSIITGIFAAIVLFPVGFGLLSGAVPIAVFFRGLFGLVIIGIYLAHRSYKNYRDYKDLRDNLK